MVQLYGFPESVIDLPKYSQMSIAYKSGLCD